MGPLGFPMRVPHLNPVLLTALIVWSLIWKGFALWRAARAGQAAWFVVLLFVNTAGLLEIAYLLFFAPRPRPPAG
jgi:methionyl-tRNA synthetase